MPNKNYRRGRAKEYRIQNKLRDEGNIVLRTAGSHGFADLIVIDKQNKIIRFIQVKPKKFSTNERVKLYEEYKWLESDFKVFFGVV